MINFEHFTLANGLEVYVHEDHTTPMAVVNLLYKVGSRDENPERTGFAHLFEHLMFGGSVNIPEYDTPLQKVGGENNAFTNTDITNYYITLPSANLETAFWLESDRMLSLSFDPEVLEVQRKVVIEEFKQRYLNQPYGDVWLKLRPLAYQVHPYQWATIGKDISHIEKAQMEDVRAFFFRWYRPNNAILVVAGDVKLEQVKQLSEKWFGDIPAGPITPRNIPVEPAQTDVRKLSVTADVPLNAWYRAYKMVGKNHPDYMTTDLLSDVLGRGKSSFLFQKLVKEKEYLNSFSAFVTGSVDEGLLVLTGKLNDGVEYAQVEEFVDAYLEEIKSGIDEKLLEKVKNQAEASVEFSEVDLLNRAMAIAFGAMLGDADLVNKEKEKIRKISASDITRIATQIFRPENSSTLYYSKIQS